MVHGKNSHRSSCLPEYQELNLDFSIQAEARAKKIRALFASEGRLKKYEDQVIPLVDKVMDFAETRNFMAHGVVISSPSPEHGIVFRMKIFKQMAGFDDHEGKMDFTAEQLKTETANIFSGANDLSPKFD